MSYIFTSKNIGDPISVVTGTIGLVETAWEIGKQSHSYFSKAKGANHSRKRFQEGVLSLTNVLVQAETRFRDAEPLGLVPYRQSSLSAGVISNCHKRLISINHEMQKHSLEPACSLHEEEIQKHINALQQINNIFSSFLAANILNTTTTTHSHVEKMIQEKEREKLRFWLDISECIHRTLPSPHPGTGQWLLDCDTYRTWRDGGPSLLWCYGAPGAGKSLLAATIIRDLSVPRHTEKTCVTHFFCDFSARAQQCTDTILKTLLLQVAEQEDLSVLQALNQMRINISRVSDSRDLARAFSLACSTSTADMFLVLDGPDELEKSEEVTPLLQSFVQAGCKIRASREEMVTYAKARFQESDFCNVFEARKHDGIIEEVVGKANGIFLLAKLFLDQLLDLDTIKQIQTALLLLPTNVMDAFQHSVARIEAQPAGQRELAYRLIGWITHSYRRLKADEIIHAFALEDGVDVIEKENCLPLARLLKVCVGLVNHDAKDGTIGMIHATAYEFFRDHLSHRNASIQLDMSKTSLFYLSTREMRSGPCRTLEEMELRIENSPFLPYAARCWRKHVVDSDTEQHLGSLITGILNNEKLRSSVFQVLQFRHQHKGQRRGPSHGTFEATPLHSQALHLAAYWDLSQITGDLLSRGDDPSPADSHGWTPLHWASSKSNRSAAGMLISGGASVDLKDSQGWTPLFWTAVNGDVGLMRELLENGASYLVRDTNGWTALMHAVSRRQRSVVEVLLEHRKRHQSEVKRLPSVLVGSLSFEQARERDVDNPTTIEIAAGVDDAGILSLLIESHFNEKSFRNLWSPHRRSRWSPCNILKPWNHREIFDQDRYYFTSHLIGRRHLDDWRSHLLHAAIRDEKPLIVKALLELGTDPNRVLERLSQTPLHTAAFRRDPQYAELLLRHGADPSQENVAGATPLHLAVANGSSATVKKLLEWKSDPNTPTRRCLDVSHRHCYGCFTPLMLACGLHERTRDEGVFEAAIQMTDLLLSYGADVCAKDFHGRTCLHHAIRSGVPEIVKKFLTAGADVSGKGGAMGMSALHYAAACWPNLQIIKMIVDAGADGSVMDDLGRNAFHHLACGRLCYPGDDGATGETIKEVVEVLVAHCGLSAMNAEWTVRNDSFAEATMYSKPAQEVVNCFFTPAALALASHKWAVFEALRSRGAIFHTNSTLQSLLNAAIYQLQPSAIRFLIDSGIRLSPNFDKDPRRFFGAFGSACFSRPPRHSISHERIRDPEKLVLIIQLLPSMGLNINNVKLRHYLPWLYAALNSNCEKITQSFLDAGADPFITDGSPVIDNILIGDEGGYDAFLQATIAGNSRILHCLLNYARIHPREGHWTGFLQTQTPAEKQEDSAQVFDALRRAGLLEKRYGKANPQTLLSKFAARGKKEEVLQLIALGANTEAVDAGGWTPLHIAAYKGHDEVAELLIQSGVDVHAMTTGWSQCYPPPQGHRQNPHQSGPWTGQALHLAAINGHASIVEKLLAYHADANARTGRIFGNFPATGTTALQIALDTNIKPSFHGGEGSRHDGQLRIAQMLLEHGADVRCAADSLSLDDVLRFEKCPELWEKLRQGISHKGKRISW